MIDTNVKGLLHGVRAFVPGMRARGRGHIIPVSSIAGKQAYGKGSVYCASKFAVEAISDSLRIETVGPPPLSPSYFASTWQRYTLNTCSVIRDIPRGDSRRFLGVFLSPPFLSSSPPLLLLSRFLFPPR